MELEFHERVIVLGNPDEDTQGMVSSFAQMSQVELYYFENPIEALNDTEKSSLDKTLLGILAFGENSEHPMLDVVAIQLAPPIHELPILSIASETPDAPVLTEISKFFLGLRVSE